MSAQHTIILAAVAILFIVIGVSGLILSAPMADEIERWKEDKD